MSELLFTKLGRLDFKNPVTVASGTFGLEYSNFFDLNKLGAIVTKTITKKSKKGNPPPRLFETSGGLLNSIGLQNVGIERFMETELLEYSKLDIPIIVSFSGSSIKEFCEMLEIFEESDFIDGYEVNISCPNVENEGIAFGTNSSVVFELTKKLREKTKKELCIKLTPNVSDIVSIAKAAEEGGADSLALINTLLGMAVNWETGRTMIAKGIAGYSGPPIKPIALMNCFKVSRAVDLPILAMGGIRNWQDAIEFFWTGASMVAFGTENFVNPTVTVETIENLENFFVENKFKLQDIIGKISGLR